MSCEVSRFLLSVLLFVNAVLLYFFMNRKHNVFQLKRVESAASSWLPLKIGDPFLSPRYDEWCLWSFEIGGEKNIFSGNLFETNGLLAISIDNHDTLQAFYRLNEVKNVFFARVRRVPEDQPRNEDVRKSF